MVSTLSNLERYEFFSEVQVWPIQPRFSPDLWLQNFNAAELKYAEALLSSFFFYNQMMCNFMLRSAFHSISTYLGESDIGLRAQIWQQFLDDCIFTIVDSEDNNPTASSHIMCRIARDMLGFDDSKFCSANQALDRLYQGASHNVVFLDDMICSGLQFTTEWTRPVNVGTTIRSFADISRNPEIHAFYTPLLASSYGILEIQKTCQNIQILPANILEPRYGVFDQDSILWGDCDKTLGVACLEAASARAGMTGKVNWKGFHQLGHTVAFAHGIPDSTLPIFSWNENGWKPLIEIS